MPVRILTLLALCCGAVAAQVRPPLPPRLTLQDAVRLAFENNPGLLRALAQADQADAASRRALAARLPQLSAGVLDALRTVNLEAQGIRLPDLPGFPADPRVGPFQQFDARVYLSQQIFDLTSRYGSRAAGRQAEASRFDALRARETLALEVAVAYSAVQRQQAEAATLERQHELGLELTNLAAQRERLQAASRLDVKRSVQQSNALEQSLLESRNALVGAKLDLARLVNAEITAEYAVEELDAPEAVELPREQQAVAEALRERADHQAAATRLEAQRLRLRGARSERLPKLDFSADWGASGNQPFHNLSTYRVQGMLSVPLYRGGAIGADVAEAEAQIEQAEADLAAVEAQIEAEVLEALAAVRSARREVEIGLENVQLAGEEVDLSRLRFEAQAADNTEVVNAQDRLARAEASRIRALYRLSLARINLRHALGAAAEPYLEN